VTDAEFDALKAKFDALIEKWVNTLGLYSWDISYAFERDSGRFVEEHGNCSALCIVKWPYMHAGIYFNMQQFVDLDDRKIEIIFIHELMHVFLKELRADDDGMDDHEERVAQMLTMALIWTREADR